MWMEISEYKRLLNSSSREIDTTLLISVQYSQDELRLNTNGLVGLIEAVMI